MSAFSFERVDYFRPCLSALAVDIFSVDVKTQHMVDLYPIFDRITEHLRVHGSTETLRTWQNDRHNFIAHVRWIKTKEILDLATDEPVLSHYADNFLDNVASGFDEIERYLRLSPIKLPKETLSIAKAQLIGRCWSDDDKRYQQGTQGVIDITVTPTGKKCVRKVFIDPDHLEYLFVEAEQLVQLDHPNIITVWAVDYDECLLIEEFAPHGDLFDSIRSKLLDAATIVRYFHQIALGLAYLHHMGVIHRDIKPENVVIFDRGVVKLIDFALSGKINNNEDEQLVKGSLEYSAPEKFRFSFMKYNTSRIDQAEDVWSFGVMLFNTFTGSMLYKNLGDLFRRCRKDFQEGGIVLSEKEVSQLKRKEASEEAVKLIERCLRFDPASRPTMEEVLKDPFFRF
jgi:serine/threonine protein kinase